MRTILSLAAIFTVVFACAQSNSTESKTGMLWQEELHKFQEELNAKFVNPDKSPLKKEDLKNFDGLEFFPDNKTFRVKADFVRTLGVEPFEMPTTTARKAIYVKYGELHFDLGGNEYVLNVYQNQKLIEEEGKENYLFVPFTDDTNGKSTYSGGRYIDLRIPKGETITLDFNKAYNPYCAYNSKYSCPIPPEENYLPLKVKAGVKAFKKS